MPVEECGDMIIMTLAYAQRASDTSYLEQHYDILKQWTGYLIEDALIPANQLSTDDFQGQLANQTNLALKGIIAIEAMSVISHLTGNLDDGTNFSTISHNYLDKWEQYAMVYTAAFPHANLDFQDDTSHGTHPLMNESYCEIYADNSKGLLYNLYADKLLGLNFVPESIYDIQSEFYPSVANTYGIPLDIRDAYTKSMSHEPIQRHQKLILVFS